MTTLDSQGPNFRVGGNIYPSRFVKGDASNDWTVLQAGTNEDAIGISTEGDANPPTSGNTLGVPYYVSGQDMKVYGPGSVCLLELGTGGITRFAYLKADTDGKGVAATTSGATAQFVGAMALESGSAGDKVRVYVVHLPKYYPALS